MVCLFHFLMFSMIFLNVLLFIFTLHGISWNHPFWICLPFWKVSFVLFSYYFFFPSIYSLISKPLLAWCSIFRIHLWSFLSFPMFSTSFPFYSRGNVRSRKQTGLYLSILLLKFYSGNWISNSTWYPLTSYVNETRGPVTTLDPSKMLPLCIFYLALSGSLGFLSNLQSCFSPLLLAQEVPEQYFVSCYETSL